MAENPHLLLTLNGKAAAGESTQRTKDGSIEIASFSWGVQSPVDAATGTSVGRRMYSSLTLTKRIDKSSPLIVQGLATNQIAEGTIKFYRPTKAGDATSENFYTIQWWNGRIESISASIGGSGDIPSETITIVFAKIQWTYDTAGAKGISYTDDWTAPT